MISFDYLGHFRGGFTLELFLIRAFVFELQDVKNAKKWILVIFRSPKQHEKKIFLKKFFFVNFYPSKKSAIRYKIVLFEKNCSGGGQKTRFWPKTSFFAATRIIFFWKKYFIGYSALLTARKVYKK